MSTSVLECVSLCFVCLCVSACMCLCYCLKHCTSRMRCSYWDASVPLVGPGWEFCGHTVTMECECITQVWWQSPQSSGFHRQSHGHGVSGKAPCSWKLFLYSHDLSWPICPKICFLQNKKFRRSFGGTWPPGSATAYCYVSVSVRMYVFVCVQFSRYVQPGRARNPHHRAAKVCRLWWICSQTLFTLSKRMVLSQVRRT